MCLETTREETEEFRRKNKDKEFIWGYKVYEILRFRDDKDDKVKLRPLFFAGSVEPGEIKSNRSRLNFDKRDGDIYNRLVRSQIWNICGGFWEINRGIHVCFDFGDARFWAKAQINPRIVKVKCLMKEFVAYNKESNAAVFRKIYLDEKEFDRAIEGKKNVSTS